MGHPTVRLILMKEKAVRIWKARLQSRVLLEELSRKQEKESNYMELESWIWSSLNTYIKSAKEVTLLDTPGVKVQAEVDIMALASRLEGMIQKSGTISSLREVLTWKLTIAIQSEENK